MYYPKIEKINYMFILLTVVMLCFSYASSAQNLQSPADKKEKVNYSDEELKQFVEANKSAGEVQKSGQEKMVKAIEEEGLTIQEFNEIARAQQTPESGNEVPESDMKKFEKVSDRINEIQNEMQQKTTAKIKEAGLTTEKYGAIMLAYQNDEMVRQRVDNILNQ